MPGDGRAIQLTDDTVVAAVHADVGHRRALAHIVRTDDVRMTHGDDNHVGPARDRAEIALRERPALIVLDMGLPIMSGEEVALRLHDVYVDPPPIIVVSADGSPATIAIGTYSTAPAADFATVGVTCTARCRGRITPCTPAPSAAIASELRIHCP